MTLRSRVAERAGELAPGEARVARFLVEHPNRVGHLSATRIGAEAGTSDATVIRTVRALGYPGLDALREAVAAELSPRARLEATLDGSAASRSPVRRFVEQRVEDVGGLGHRLAGDVLERAVAVLARGRRIWVVGFGPSSFLAGYAVHQLRRAGAPASAVTATGADLADELLELAPGDAVALLSYDRASVAVDVVFSRAEALDVPVVLVTDGAVAGAARATVVVDVGRGEPTLTPSHAATIVVLEALALAVAARHARRAARAGQLLEELRDELARRTPRPTRRSP